MGNFQHYRDKSKGSMPKILAPIPFWEKKERKKTVRLWRRKEDEFSRKPATSVVSVIDTENRITMETIAKLGERVRCSGKVFHFLEGRRRKLVRLSTNRMVLSGASTRGRTRVSKTIHINVFPLQGYTARQREQE